MLNQYYYFDLSKKKGGRSSPYNKKLSCLRLTQKKISLPTKNAFLKLEIRM